MSLILEVVPQ